jgi:hypothetical protein
MVPESAGRPSCTPLPPGGNQRGGGTVEVTPAMVAAASAVLRESGLLEQYPGRPAELVVQDMLRSALRTTKGA